jgi:hypothetical protein
MTTGNSEYKYRVINYDLRSSIALTYCPLCHASFGELNETGHKAFGTPLVTATCVEGHRWILDQEQAFELAAVNHG